MPNRIEKQDGGKVVPLHPKRKKSMNILYALLAVLVVGVSVYQIFRINYSPVETEIALETTVDNAVTVEGFVYAMKATSVPMRRAHLCRL